jgi:hypothetical protein
MFLSILTSPIGFCRHRARLQPDLAWELFQIHSNREAESGSPGSMKISRRALYPSGYWTDTRHVYFKIV